MPSYTQPWYEVELEILTPDDQTYGTCIIESLCAPCTDTAAASSGCTSVQMNLTQAMFYGKNLTRYGAAIEYKCPPGQMFRNGTELVDTILLGCHHEESNGTSVVYELPNCEGIYNYST